MPARAIPPHRILPATRLPATKANLETHALAAVRMGTEYPARGTVKGDKYIQQGGSGEAAAGALVRFLARAFLLLVFVVKFVVND